MKKNDYKLIVGIVAAAVILFLVFMQKLSGAESAAEVSVNGRVTGVYRLDEDRRIDINGTNVLVITDGHADMTEADCPDGLCVRQKPISGEGESIVCLPNRVIVTIIPYDGREQSKSLD